MATKKEIHFQLCLILEVYTPHASPADSVPPHTQSHLLAQAFGLDEAAPTSIKTEKKDLSADLALLTELAQQRWKSLKG